MKFFETYEEIAKLKSIIRRGWEMRNVQGRLESDAEHTYSMLLSAIILIEKNKLNLDPIKTLKMIAYHELCEIDSGDITPFDKITREEKFAKEHNCIKRLSEKFQLPEIEAIWLEFEEEKTNEAKFVKQLDKFDAIMQSQIYANENKTPELFEEFYNYSKNKIQDIEKLQ